MSARSEVGLLRGRALPARRTEVVVFGAILLAAVAAALLIPTYPNYDSYWHLVWGRDLFAGRSPEFQAYQAPTEHPLWVAAGALLSRLGTDADRVLVVGCVASFALLTWAVFRVGRACFGVWPGAVAALFCGSSFAFGLYAARGYVDVPFLAVVLWAAALEAERPRRGIPVMVLLAVAGLLRPEAWVLAGLYWLWCGPLERRAAAPRGVEGADGGAGARGRRAARLPAPFDGPLRLDLLALVLVAPVLWCVTDAVVTGDPLYSIHATSSLADQLGRSRGIGAVPRSFVSFLADTARPPVFAAGIAGAWLAWRDRAHLRALHVPAALFLTGAVTFVGTGVAGLSVLSRYLTVPAVAVMLFAGYAVAGFTLRAPGVVRTWWTRGAIAVAVLGVAFLVVKLDSFHRLATELRFIRRTHTNLAAVLADPRVAAARRCGPTTLPNYRLVPDVRWRLDAPPGAVGARSDRKATSGVELVLVGRKPIRRFGKADGADPRTNTPDPGFRLVARHGMFAAYARCG